jgi:hypothetical protein
MVALLNDTSFRESGSRSRVGAWERTITGLDGAYDRDR